MALYPRAAQIGLGGLFMKMEEKKKDVKLGVGGRSGTGWTGVRGRCGR